MINKQNESHFLDYSLSFGLLTIQMVNSIQNTILTKIVFLLTIQMALTNTLLFIFYFFLFKQSIKTTKDKTKLTK